MATWTDEQRTAIFEDYWATGGGRCPEDESILDINFTPFIGVGAPYQLTARCPRCGRMAKFSRDDDPRRDQFRPWTDAEKEQLVDAYFRRRSGVCPVCGTGVRMDQSSGAHPTVQLHCRRCGNFHVHTPAAGR